MISEIFEQQLVFHERVLLVPDSQREAVEAVLRQCGCNAEWSQAVSEVAKYNNGSAGSGVSVWVMSLASKDDAKVVQSALDAIE